MMDAGSKSTQLNFCLSYDPFCLLDKYSVLIIYFPPVIIGYNAEKLPLGKLSKSTILKASV